MKLRSALAITIALLALSQTWPALAVPSAMSHEMSGAVQRMDRKTVTILPTGSSKPVAFAWNAKETQFFQNGRPTKSDALPIGANVQIHCSHPIIGSMPTLYRVFWQTTASAGKTKPH
jgi:hypothetical protein